MFLKMIFTKHKTFARLDVLTMMLGTSSLLGHNSVYVGVELDVFRDSFLPPFLG
jgi:hypothetical protein